MRTIPKHLLCLLFVLGLAAETLASRSFLGSDRPHKDLSGFLSGDFDTLIVGGRPGGWITGPLRVSGDHKTIILLPGTEIRAQPGAFPGMNDVLLLLENLENVKVIGYGARLVMHKADYTSGEWRHAVSIRGSQGVRIEGLAIDSSGGDGIYVDGSPGGKPYSRDVHVLHCALSGHRRQGISVISAENFLVEHSRVVDTRGTAPSAGIDFEPDNEGQRLRNCTVSNNVFSGNQGPQALIDLRRFSGASLPVSIRFVDNLFEGSSATNGVLVRAYRGSVTESSIRFERNVFRNPSGPALLLRATTRPKATIRFDSSLFDGTSPQAFLESAGPVLRFHESRAHDNPSGVVEAARFEATVIRSGGRAPIAFTPLEVRPARDILMQVHWSRGSELQGDQEGRKDPPQLQAGVTWERLEVAPAWSPPPPQIAGFQRRRDGTIQVRLAAWSGDSLEYSLDGADPRRSGSSAGLRLPAVGELRAVTRRGGLSSDTLFWKIPRYP